MSEAVDLDWQYLSDLADRVALSISTAWAIVEKDDVKQEILAHAYEHRKTIEETYENEAFLWKLFKKAAHQYASRERDYRDLLDDQYYYTPDEVKVALRSFLYTDDEMGEMLGRQDDLIRARVDDNLVSARLDASSCLPRLNERYRGLLTTRYVYGLPVTNAADEMALSRATVALARLMNRHIRSKAAA